MRLSPCLSVLVAVFLGACTAQGAGVPQAPAAFEAEGAGGNRVRFEVDGQAFAFRTPQLRHGRSRTGQDLVARHFELASADQSLYARLVLNVEAGRADLSGRYLVVPGGGDDAATAGTAELMLAEETDPVRGRRMFPGGAGEVEVTQREGYFQVRFSITGDGLFRDSDAAPVEGELAFHAPS